MRPLRICIPFEVGVQGGMTTFMRYWMCWLEEAGHRLITNIGDDYDVLFLNSWKTQARDVYRAKSRLPELRVLHRLDGSALEYGRTWLDDLRQANSNLLADVTVYQSNFAKTLLGDKKGLTSRNGTVIQNPVDLELFTPAITPPDVIRPRFCVVSFSTNRLKGTWQISSIAKARPDWEFDLIGRFPPLPSLRNLNLRGELRGGDLVAALQKCHGLIQLSRNDAAPNVVSEALACGLPVAYIDSGGVPEIVGKAGARIHSLKSAEKSLSEILTKFPYFRCEAIKQSKQFSLHTIFPRYIHAIETANRQALPTRGALLSSFLSNALRARSKQLSEV